MKTRFNPWPCGIIIFFVLLFCGLATVVVIASTHRESLVNENYYEQELKFQNQIDAAARAKNSGATINYDAAAGQIQIALPAAQVRQPPAGSIELYRPSAANLDRRIKLQPDAGGLQTLDATILQPGLWIVRVAWNAGGQDYFLEDKIVAGAKKSP
jgi:nitrogen fixation protein FixH